MLLLLDAAWFVSAFGKDADGNVALLDETTVVTVAVSLHSLPVASMPPFVPPEQSWAWADSEKNIAAISGIRGFAFMSVLSFELARE
jgi:hypothetical protein